MKQAVLQVRRYLVLVIRGDIKRIIKEMTEPKMDWREHLNLAVQFTSKSDLLGCVNHVSHVQWVSIASTDNDFR